MSGPNGGERTIKIGEVAEHTELSIRSLRHYDELGLVSPTAHSPGGFRLYTQADVERILLIRRMKPLGFSLDRMKDFCRALDQRASDPAGSAATLIEIREEASERLDRLRRHLAYAEEFVDIVEGLD